MLNGVSMPSIDHKCWKTVFRQKWVIYTSTGCRFLGHKDGNGLKIKESSNQVISVSSQRCLKGQQHHFITHPLIPRPGIQMDRVGRVKRPIIPIGCVPVSYWVSRGCKKLVFFQHTQGERKSFQQKRLWEDCIATLGQESYEMPPRAPLTIIYVEGKGIVPIRI